MLKQIHTLMVLLTFTSFAWGQTFTIRITPEAGFDAIDSIYNEFNNQQPQSILTILNEFPPEDVEYLIRNRPFGNRLELMIASPDWAAAQLARMMVVTYSYPVDVTAVKENFENHPSLEMVSYNYNVDPINHLPEAPNDNESTFVELAFLPFMDCQTPATNPQGLDHDIEIIGNIINILWVGSGPTLPSTFICGIQESAMIPYEIGVLTEGYYTINIFNVFQSTAFPAPANERYLIGQTNLMVRGTQPVSVPTFSLWAIVLLALSLILYAYKSSHKKFR